MDPFGEPEMLTVEGCGQLAVTHGQRDMVQGHTSIMTMRDQTCLRHPAGISRAAPGALIHQGTARPEDGR